MLRIGNLDKLISEHKINLKDKKFKHLIKVLTNPRVTLENIENLTTLSDFMQLYGEISYRLDSFQEFYEYICHKYDILEIKDLHLLINNLKKQKKTTYELVKCLESKNDIRL